MCACVCVSTCETLQLACVLWWWCLDPYTCPFECFIGFWTWFQLYISVETRLGWCVCPLMACMDPQRTCWNAESSGCSTFISTPLIILADLFQSTYLSAGNHTQPILIHLFLSRSLSCSLLLFFNLWFSLPLSLTCKMYCVPFLLDFTQMIHKHNLVFLFAFSAIFCVIII